MWLNDLAINSLLVLLSFDIPLIEDYCLDLAEVFGAVNMLGLFREFLFFVVSGIFNGLWFFASLFSSCMLRSSLKLNY